MQIFKFLRSFVRATKIVSYGVQTTVFFLMITTLFQIKINNYRMFIFEKCNVPYLNLLNNLQ